MLVWTVPTMKFLILTVVSAAVASAQLIPGNFGSVGEEVGGRVGAGIGGGFGRVLDGEIPDVVPPVRNPGRRPYDNTRVGYRQDVYNSGGSYDNRDYVGGSSASGGQRYETQDSGGTYVRGGSYSREKMVKEREQATGFDTGRGGQSSSRGGSGGRYDNYGRDRASYGAGYNQAYNRK